MLSASSKGSIDARVNGPQTATLDSRASLGRDMLRKPRSAQRTVATRRPVRDPQPYPAVNQRIEDQGDVGNGLPTWCAEEDM